MSKPQKWILASILIAVLLLAYRVFAQSQETPKLKLLPVVQASRIEIIDPRTGQISCRLDNGLIELVDPKTGNVTLKMENVKAGITGRGLPRVQLFGTEKERLGEIGIRLGADGKEHAYFYMLSEDTKVSLLTLPPVWRVR